MKVLVSWSGPASHKVALALRRWLPGVLPEVEPWVSWEDIPKGRRWGRELDEQLEQIFFSIVCVVPGNVREPWINYEAGAVARVVDRGQVSPLLVGVAPEDLSGTPLSLFQATRFTKDDMAKLLLSMNGTAHEPESESRVLNRLEVTWADFYESVSRISLAEADEDDAEADEVGGISYYLDEGPEKVLQFIAECGPEHPTTHTVAINLGEHEVRVAYWIDELLNRSMIHDHLNTRKPTSYSLNPAGRAYLVENDLI